MITTLNYDNSSQGQGELKSDKAKKKNMSV